jgi:hypothetical protein
LTEIIDQNSSAQNEPKDQGGEALKKSPAKVICQALFDNGDLTRISFPGEKSGL